MTQMPDHAAKRVLIYRIGSLGDTVVALPSFHLIARHFPDAERKLLTNIPIASKAPAAAAVLENTGLVHGYFRYAVGTRSAKELLKLWWSIVRWRPDALIYLSPARGVREAKRDATFFRLCGVRRLIGVPYTEDLQKNCIDSKTGALEFEAERLARTIADLGDAAIENPLNWSLHLTQGELDKAAQVLQPAGGKPVIAVSIGTKVQANEWGRENWTELLFQLAMRYPGYALAIAGAPTDFEESERIAEGWRRGPSATNAGPVINLCGQLSPRESGALFATAKIFLGHDSGPMHLAAAAQTPCVAVFSARGKPRVWFPYGEKHRVLYHKVECGGCNLDTCVVENKKCILSIRVDEVLAEVSAVLG